MENNDSIKSQRNVKKNIWISLPLPTLIGLNEAKSVFGCFGPETQVWFQRRIESSLDILKGLLAKKDSFVPWVKPLSYSILHFYIVYEYWIWYLVELICVTIFCIFNNNSVHLSNFPDIPGTFFLVQDPLPNSWLDEQNSPHPKRVINKAKRGVRLHNFLGNHWQNFNWMSARESIWSYNSYTPLTLNPQPKTFKTNTKANPLL